MRRKWIFLGLSILFLEACSYCDEYRYFLTIPHPAHKIEILIFVKPNQFGAAFASRDVSCRYRFLSPQGDFGEWDIKELGLYQIVNNGRSLVSNDFVYKWLSDQQLELSVDADANKKQNFLITIKGDSVRLEEKLLEKNNSN
jgi:hypothetical protein